LPCSVNLVIVHDLDVCGALGRPNKTDPELVVDPYRMLPFAITSQGFETIARRRIQVGQIGRGVEVPQLAARNLDQIGRKTLRLFAAEDGFGRLVPKASDHDRPVSLDDTAVNNNVSANDTANLWVKEHLEG
jgi:hypothetical protein